jgi:hypothetical protein
MAKKTSIPVGRTPAPRRKAAKTPISARTLRELSRVRRLLREETRAVMNEIKQSSDGAACILMSAMVERWLERSLLLRLMIQSDDKTSALFERDGALSTFYGNTHLAYALDMITSETRNDLDIIRRTRNAFAHSQLPLSFQSEEISKELGKLSHTTYSRSKTNDTSALNVQKLRFMECSISIMIALTNATGQFLDIQSALISALSAARAAP